MGARKGFVDSSYEVVASGFGNVETTFVVKSAVVEVPVPWGGARERDGVGLHSGESVYDKLVRGSGFSDFGGKGRIQQVNMECGKKRLFNVVGGGVDFVFSGEGVSRAHSGTRRVVPFQIVILEEHLPSSLSSG